MKNFRCKPSLLSLPLRAGVAAVLFFTTATSVFAQSDLFNRLAALDVGVAAPAWVSKEGIPVPNTDLTDSGKQLYSFSSEYPLSPYLVTIRDGNVIAIRLPIPAGERRRVQEVFFTERYSRVLLGQDSSETIYFLPSFHAMLVLDTITGDVIRLEKKYEAPAAVLPAQIPLATKHLAYTVIALSVGVIAVLLVALGIEVRRWEPKETDSAAIVPY